MKVSEEIRKLDKKEGNVFHPLTDLVQQYLDAKNANYTVLKAQTGEAYARPKGVDPFVEPGSIMIENDGKKVIIEELTKTCGGSGRYHDREAKVRTDVILNKTSRIVFKTHKDKRSLHIHTDGEIKDPIYGFYLGGGTITVDMEDILKEPSKIPEDSETFEIDCNCEEGMLKCKGNVWQW